ncbi:MAG: hypothetical protein [Wendovervirus sonii]|uniref:DNA primase n=1 Tax=phage Lak_Megaphage_Sonny TaxID=3109229 RepID=A0ABZ0Z668_9CAUD|nr:MAG: hypothetical protein [phage Lak_Megaphage_Sonny]
MAAVNNFNLIKNNISFLNERSFYFIQVLKRKKENPEMHAYSELMGYFYIFNKEQLEKAMPQIIDLCEKNRARAYIKMNMLDARSVMCKQGELLFQDMRKDGWQYIHKNVRRIIRIALNIRFGWWQNIVQSYLFNSACGQCGKQDGAEKLYLVDLDDVTPYSHEMNDVAKFINYSLEPLDHPDKVKMVVPTRNGCHLLTTGFNMESFRKVYPRPNKENILQNGQKMFVDVHDDGITLLYFPACCN